MYQDVDRVSSRSVVMDVLVGYGECTATGVVDS